MYTTKVRYIRKIRYMKSLIKKALGIPVQPGPYGFAAHIALYEKRMQPRKPLGKNVYIYTLVPWIHSHIEYTLGKIFQYEGYDVTHVICGGGLPVCGMENKKTMRPDCADCILMAEGLAAAYGAKFVRLGSPAGHRDCGRLISSLSAKTPEEVREFVHDEIPYGRLCMEDYTQYAHAKYELDDIAEEEPARTVWVKGIATQVLLHDAVKGFHAQKRHDIAVVSNGKSFAYTGVYKSLRRLGVDTVTWDETPTYYNSFIFKENDYANEVHIDRLFESTRGALDNIDYKGAVDGYFRRWEEEGHHTFKYYAAPLSDTAEIEREIGRKFSDYAKVVTLYTNITWDTAALGRDRAFHDMADWLAAFVRAVAGRKDTLLLVRSHPAEDKVPMRCRTMQKVGDCILEKVGSLPSNVVVIPGSSDISSYKLFRISDINSVYTTTLGLEMALQGVGPYVAGLTHYGSKGFTNEIMSGAEVDEILKTCREDNMLDEGRKDVAYRYAYTWLMLSLFRPANLAADRASYSLDEYEKLVSDGSEYYRLYESIVRHETADMTCLDGA